MLRALRRFRVRDDAGRLHAVSEVETFPVVEVRDGAPTLVLSSNGFHVVPGGRPGEYTIPRLRLAAVDAGPAGSP